MSSSKSIAPEPVEQIVQRHSALSTREAIGETVEELCRAIESGSFSDRIDQGDRVGTLHLHLNELFCRLYDETEPARLPLSFNVGELYFWARKPSRPGAKWTAMLTVQGCDRELGERDTAEDALALCDQRSRMRLV
jgi:hypothetical protein